VRRLRCAKAARYAALINAVLEELNPNPDIHTEVVIELIATTGGRWLRFWTTDDRGGWYDRRTGIVTFARSGLRWW
jgi:hypothetical protein